MGYDSKTYQVGDYYDYVNGKYVDRMWKSDMQSRTTSTGCNTNTSGYRPIKTYKEQAQEYCDKLVCEIKATKKEFTPKERKDYFSDEKYKKYGYHCDVVRECLEDLDSKEKTGWVFKQTQLEDVMRLYGYNGLDVKSSHYNEYIIHNVR